MAAGDDRDDNRIAIVCNVGEPFRKKQVDVIVGPHFDCALSITVVPGVGRGAIALMQVTQGNDFLFVRSEPAGDQE